MTGAKGRGAPLKFIRRICPTTYIGTTVNSSSSEASNSTVSFSYLLLVGIQAGVVLLLALLALRRNRKRAWPRILGAHLSCHREYAEDELRRDTAGHRERIISRNGAEHYEWCTAKTSMPI